MEGRRLSLPGWLATYRNKVPPRSYIKTAEQIELFLAERVPLLYPALFWKEIWVPPSGILCQTPYLQKFRNCMSTVAGVVNLGRSPVYHTERPTSFITRWPYAGRRAGLFAAAETCHVKIFIC